MFKIVTPGLILELDPNGRGGDQSSIQRHKRKLFINLLHKNFFVIICEITMQRFYDSKILNC